MDPSSTLKSFTGFLPPELLSEIFSHLSPSPSTLAVLARTSFTCLEIVSPLLYSDVVLHDMRKIKKLLRLTNPSNHPTSERVSRLTSPSLIKSFTCSAKNPKGIYLPPPSFDPIPIDILAIFVPPTPADERPPPFQAWELLRLFAPKTLLLRGTQSRGETFGNRLRATDLLPSWSGIVSTSFPLPFQRVSSIVFSNIKTHPSYLLLTLLQYSSEPTITIYHDFLDIPAKADGYEDTQSHQNELLARQVFFVSTLQKDRRRRVKIVAWVPSELAREEAVGKVKEKGAGGRALEIETVRDFVSFEVRQQRHLERDTMEGWVGSVPSGWA